MMLVGIRFLLFCFQFDQEILVLSVLGVSVNLVDSYWYVFLFICWYISRISRSENQPFLWSFELGQPAFGVLHQIQEILVKLLWVFLDLLFDGCTTKITVKWMFVVFPCPFSKFECLRWEVAELVLCVSESVTGNIPKMPTDYSMMAIRRAVVDHQTQTCCPGSTLNYVSNCHLFIDKLWLINIKVFLLLLLSELWQSTSIFKKKMTKGCQKHLVY